MKLNIDQKRALASVGVIALMTVTGIFIWEVVQERAKAAKMESQIVKSLSSEELSHVLKSEATADRPTIEALAKDPKKKKEFIRGLKEHLALAAQARREGFAEQEDFKVNFAYKKDMLLADLYRAKLSQGKKRLYVVPQEDIEAVWKDPKNEAAFKREMDALQRIRIADIKAKGGMTPAFKLAGEMLKNAKENWASIRILSRRAKADKEFISQPAIDLRFKILEAGILSADYLRAKTPLIKATPSEISAYLAAHPEYDPKIKFATAKKVLAKVKECEDFESLAKKYSEDNASSQNGGLYKDMVPGGLWPEIEKAAASMKPGEVYPDLIETETGYHILKFIKRAEAETGGPTLTIRHIVIQKRFREPGDPIPGIPRPFMTPEEIARGEISRKKKKDFIAGVVASNPIDLPENFDLDLEEQERALGGE